AAGSRGPEPDAYRQAMRDGFADAGVDPATITLVVGNGTGSPAEDRCEAEALVGFLPQPVNGPPVLTSAVGDVGYAGAASFAASLLKACFALDQEILPPIRNTARPLAEIGERFRVLPDPQYWVTNRADGPRR